jgi:4-amino-4-deoxy-L-arabinose transferase-like glycosyltransferase
MLAICKRLARHAVPIFAIVTAAKIAIFLVLISQNRVVPFVGDYAADHYLPTAHRLLTEGRFNGPNNRPDSKVAPGYSAVLALFVAFLHRHYDVAAVGFQMFADFAVAVALFVLARRFLDPVTGALAGLVWLFYPPAVAISTWITAETLFTGIFISSVALLLIFWDRPALASLFAGCVLGLATLFRGTTLFLPPLLLIAFIRKRSYGQGVAFLVGFSLLIVPWAIRNRIVLNDPITISVGSGGAFLQGSDERNFTIDGKTVAMPLMHAEAALHGITKPANEYETQIDHWLFEVGLYNYKKRLAERPFSFLPFFMKKFFLLWYSTETGTFKGELMLALCSLPFVVPGLWQLWRWNRAPSDFTVVCGLVVIYFIFLHVATGPLNRYMLPVYPILILAACDWWITRLTGASRVHQQLDLEMAPVQKGFHD